MNMFDCLTNECAGIKLIPTTFGVFFDKATCISEYSREVGLHTGYKLQLTPTRHRRLHLRLAPMVKICFEGNDVHEV